MCRDHVNQDRLDMQKWTHMLAYTWKCIRATQWPQKSKCNIWGAKLSLWQEHRNYTNRCRHMSWKLELPKQSLRHPLRQLCCRFVQVFTCEARVQQTAYMRNDCLVQVHITPLRYQPICRRRNIFPDPTCEACFRQSSCEHCIQTLMCGGHPKGWSRHSWQCLIVRIRYMEAIHIHTQKHWKINMLQGRGQGKCWFQNAMPRCPQMSDPTKIINHRTVCANKIGSHVYEIPQKQFPTVCAQALAM